MVENSVEKNINESVNFDLLTYKDINSITDLPQWFTIGKHLANPFKLF